MLRATTTLAGQTILALFAGPTQLLRSRFSAVCAETGAELSREYEGTSLNLCLQIVA